MWLEPTANDIADVATQSLAKGDENSAKRAIFRFLERYDGANTTVRDRMAHEKPASTGSSKFDALLAAVVEYACAIHRVTPPDWVNDDDTFLDHFWFVSDMASLHANALQHSPISFARRGIFITEDALSYA